MKLDTNLLTHETKGEHYVISTGNSRFKGIIKNNQTAAFIVECLKEETTESSITDKIMAEYRGADRSIVERDVANIIGKLRSAGAIVE